jgi:hypothetical protein
VFACLLLIFILLVNPWENKRRFGTWSACSAKQTKKTKVWLTVLDLSESFFGLFFGAVGSLLFYMTFFTDHDYTWRNLNVAFINPLAFALVPLGIIQAVTKLDKRRKNCMRVTAILYLYIFIAALCTIIINLSGLCRQDNAATLILVLPMTLVFALWYGSSVKGVIYGRLADMG